MAEYTPISMIDSGAYSAWTQGTHVDLGAYCEYLQEHRWVNHYIALDEIIPGDPETAAARSHANFALMQARGLDPMPVFHQGENIVWLQRYLEANPSYIGLSATSLRRGLAPALEWYEQVWSYLVNRDGDPVVKVHCFGDTREQCLRVFPWASADSISWVLNTTRQASFKLDHVTLSHRTDTGGSGSRDLSTLSPADWAVLRARLYKYGLDPEVFAERPVNAKNLRGNYAGKENVIRHRAARAFLHIKSYQEREAVLAALPRRFFPRGGLVVPPTLSDRPAVTPGFRFFLGIGGSSTPWTLPVLWASGQRSILASYFYPDAMAFIRDFTADPLLRERPNLKLYYDLTNSIFAQPAEVAG